MQDRILPVSDIYPDRGSRAESVDIITLTPMPFNSPDGMIVIPAGTRGTCYRDVHKSPASADAKRGIAASIKSHPEMVCTYLGGQYRAIDRKDMKVDNPRTAREYPIQDRPEDEAGGLKPSDLPPELPPLPTTPRLGIAERFKQERGIGRSSTRVGSNGPALPGVGK